MKIVLKLLFACVLFSLLFSCEEYRPPLRYKITGVNIELLKVISRCDSVLYLSTVKETSLVLGKETAYIKVKFIIEEDINGEKGDPISPGEIFKNCSIDSIIDFSLYALTDDKKNIRINNFLIKPDTNYSYKIADGINTNDFSDLYGMDYTNIDDLVNQHNTCSRNISGAWSNFHRFGAVFLCEIPIDSTVTYTDIIPIIQFSSNKKVIGKFVVDENGKKQYHNLGYGSL